MKAFVPKYVQVYQLYEQGVSKTEIARRIYGVVNYHSVKRVERLLNYAIKKLEKTKTIVTRSNGEILHTPLRYYVYDPRTGYKILVEGTVLEERLPETEFMEAYIPHSNPVPHSMTGLGVIFNYKSIGKVQANPPGGLREEGVLELNEALELMDNILGLLGVGEESIVREEAGKIIHDNKDKLLDKHMFELVVLSACLIAVLVHKPGLLDKIVRIINDLYRDMKHMVVGTIYKLKIPPVLLEKALKGLLEYILNSN